MDKEKIFVELRKYHTDAFSDKLSTPQMDELHEEFAELEDNTVSMLLSLVNGKSEFVDLSNNLAEFKKKIKVDKSTEKKEVEDRNFFTAKIEHLETILNMAKLAVFRLKVPRIAKAVAAK